MTQVPESDPQLQRPQDQLINNEPTEYLGTLNSILMRNGLPAANAIRLSAAHSWTQEEMVQIERTILERIKGKDDIKPALDCLRKLAALDRPANSSAVPLPRSIHPLRLEANPFRADLGNAEQQIDHLRNAIALHSDQRIGDQDAAARVSPKSILALILLSSVADLQLLDLSLQIALIEALADRKNHLLELNSRLSCFVLSVRWRNQLDAERRLYIPDRRTARLISLINEDQVRQILASVSFADQSIDQRRKLIHRMTANAVAELLPEPNTSAKALSLDSVVAAARICVYLHVPSVVAALRSRKSVSHAPPLSVLRRLASRRPIAVSEDQGNSRPALQSTKIDEADADAEVQNISEVEPSWLTEMRVAFRAQSAKQSIAALSRIGRSHEPPGSLIAQFADHLLSRSKLSQASAKRFGLLIARRLGCRLGNLDPTTLSIGELEELYEEALEDDWDGVSNETDADAVRQSKRMTVSAISRFHAFLQDTCNVGPLEDLKDRLKPQGLLPVDANFITIDEFRLVLEAVNRDQTLNDPHLRGAVRLMVTLCFWCGLRRNEAIFLRASDLDAAGYLHVRPYALRKLKTRNSNRTLPAAILLPEEHFSELKHLAQSRSEAANSREGALLFSRREDVSELLNKDWVFRTITRIMRDTLGDNSLKIHHLRHSFATLLAAKLLPRMHGFAALLLKRHTLTLDWLNHREEFRGQLFGTRGIRSADLQAIAHLLGHSSPGMSVEHYIHCLDWCESDAITRHPSRRTQ